MTDYLVNLGANSFSMPTLTTVGNDSYYILKILCYPTLITTGTNTSVASSLLVDSTALFLSNGVSVGDIVANGTTGAIANILQIISNTSVSLSGNIFPSSGENYRIFSSKVKEADKVSVGKITMLNSSIYTEPSELFPSYTLEAQTIKVYPSTIRFKGQLQAVYFRFPKTPKWTYVTLTSGEPSFDQSQPDYQDFELPNEDGYKLVTKILEYCGISIRETEVTQFGMAQQQHEQPTFSMQQ